MAQDFFISAQELSEKLGTPDLRILDASWYLPAMGRNGFAEYETERVPGARYFDINAIADTSTDLPHMLPSPELFSEEVGKMGISETDEIVVYDGPGVFSSARLWWTFRTMGAQNVRILTGGIDGWKAEGMATETGAPKTPQASTFRPDLAPHKVRDLDYMLANVKRGETLVLDARPYGRFIGADPEPREGLRSGHIPGSRSLPALDIVRDGRLLDAAELQTALEERGVSPDIHVTTTCGSGVTAAVLSLALETIGHQNQSLYDGSWADWGAQNHVPVARWE